MINEFNQEEKTFFTPGQLVKIRQDIPNSPIMIVSKVERNIIRNKDNKNELLRGIRCRWFTDNGFLQEAIFSTKDLQLI